MIEIRGFDEYVDGVMDGSIVVGTCVKQAVERHIADVARQATPDFPYTFNREAASQAILAFPVLFRHTVGNYAGTPFELSPWQAFVVGSIWGWKDKDGNRRFRRAYVTLGRKNGKALSLDTRLPTPKGFTTMGEVKVGDYLIGGNGNPVMVEAVTEVMEGRRCLELEFTTGEKVVCDEQHEWVTRTKSDTRRGREPSVRTAKEISETLKYGVSRPENNHRIESVVTLGEKVELPIPPYTLGVWLGDGDCRGGRIYGHADDIQPVLSRISSEGVGYHEVSSGGKPAGNVTYSLELNGPSTVGVLRDAGVLGDKHIPEAYFHSSVEQRMDLLSGLMDTDGYVSKKGECEFTQKSGQLVKDVARLLYTLGVSCCVKYSRMTLEGRDVGEKGRIQFHPPNWMTDNYNLFAIPRKLERVRKRKEDGTRKIVGAKRVASVPVKCVQVTGGTYLCSEGYILTHNSTLAAGIAILMANFDNEPAAQCFIGASKIDQAKIIFEECKRMIGSSPHLRELADRRSLQINFDSTNSFIRPLGSDRAFDGLNPHLVLFDELHVWREQHRGFYDTLTTGSAARSQPLQFTITTAGSTSSNIWIEVEGLAKKVLDGSFEEESFFAYIAQIDADDDILNEDNWIKSMPNLGVSVDIDYIREQAREAAVSAVSLNRFRRYFANQIVSPTEAAINLDKWDSCAGEFSDWKDACCITAGVDIGGRNDLAAIAFCARFPDGTDDEGNRAYRYEIKTKTYLDADSSRDLNEMPFMQFIQDKLLHIVPAVTQEMENDILGAMQGYRSKIVGLDPWNAQFLAERLDMAGMEPVMVQQNRFKLNEPCLLLLDLIEKRKLRHDGDRILRWCAGNLVFSIDTAGRVMPDKSESNEKIDAIVASIIALKLASLAPERPRGPLFVS